MDKVKKTRKTPFLMVVLILIVAVGGVWYYFSRDNYSDLVPNRPADEGKIIAQTRINILIVGTDVNDVVQDKGRADAILVASLDLEHKSINLLSVPRDTLVEIPGYHEDKINHSFSMGGVELVRESVEELLHIPIDYHAVTNFNGFKEVVDILGGVEIDVDKRMYYKTYDGIIDIQKGLQRLDGEKALQYVRFRRDAMGDITRTGRQQQFLIALYNEITASENISKLPQVVPKLLEVIDTDFSAAQLIRLAKLAGEFDFSKIESASLPGDFATIKGISYWRYNRDETTALVNDFFTDKLETEETLPLDEETP